ncbi:MAG TPA: group II truncated hemoglobin [Planctomycetota bacterium]|nr:group II truncated hemoglobin [Planctomycetota bacterium]
MSSDRVPSLFEWIGGQPALDRLLERFYGNVAKDPLIGPLFAHMDARHPRFVAQFLAEVLGGPDVYSQQRGGHPHMVGAHRQRQLTEAQRRRWLDTLLSTADEVGLPDDPEFRSAFVAYLEWGSRLAVINSQPGAAVDPHAPMPHWGWGETRGPYRGG